MPPWRPGIPSAPPRSIPPIKHSGAQSGHLGGDNFADDEVQQTVSIPADASAATIDFWYQPNTDEFLSDSDSILLWAVEHIASNQLSGRMWRLHAARQHRLESRDARADIGRAGKRRRQIGGFYFYVAHQLHSAKRSLG